MLGCEQSGKPGLAVPTGLGDRSAVDAAAENYPDGWPQADAVLTADCLDLGLELGWEQEVESPLNDIEGQQKGVL